MRYHLIACVDKSWGIGKNNSIPWPGLTSDLKYFKTMTKGKTVIMGRKTWESLPKKPLPGRLNIVMTSSPSKYKQIRSEGGMPALSIIDAINQIPGYEENVYIIGGAAVYEMFKDYIDFVHITKLAKSFDCDTFLPECYRKFKVVATAKIRDEKSGLLMHFKVGTL